MSKSMNSPNYYVPPRQEGRIPSPPTAHAQIDVSIEIVGRVDAIRILVGAANRDMPQKGDTTLTPRGLRETSTEPTKRITIEHTMHAGNVLLKHILPNDLQVDFSFPDSTSLEGAPELIKVSIASVHAAGGAVDAAPKTVIVEP